MTCRSKEYLDAVRPPGGPVATLRAAAVQLRPLDADAVRGYLSDDVADPAARARWAPVLAVLGTKTPAGQALRTPLMTGLARAIYNPRPGELARTVRDPAELCGPALADRAAVESLLFDAFIPAAYRPPTAGRWTAARAETSLAFLARHLEHTIGGPDLAWWQLHKAVRTASGLVAGLAAGLVIGLWAGLVASMLQNHVAVIHDHQGVAGVASPAAVAADELSRRCPSARRPPASRCGLPVPAHRATAPARQPGRSQARNYRVAPARGRRH